MNEFSTDRRGEAARHDSRTRMLVTLTTYVSVIPYIGLAAWMWSHNGAASHVLAVYAALMFVYTGAVQWGWAIADRPSIRVYGWSMLALVIGWILASLLQYWLSLILLAVVTTGFWYVEQRWFADYTPQWYRSARAVTAILGSLCLLAAWIAVLVH